MIDNCNLMEDFFWFNENNEQFFTVVIVRRNKDFPKEIKIKEKIIQSYYVRSFKQLSDLKEEITTICSLYGARAYINLNAKSLYEFQKKLTLQLATYSLNNVVISIDKLISGVVGKITGNNKKYIIDIDNKEDLPGVIEKVESSILKEIPTVSGVHLICSKFDVKDFNTKYPNISVHKNSMGTLLYYNNRKFEINYGLKKASKIKDDITDIQKIIDNYYSEDNLFHDFFPN